MSFLEFDGFLPSTGLGWLVLLVGVPFVLYLARVPAHLAIQSLSRVLYAGFRLGAASLLQAEKAASARNREVLLAAGREAAERIIEREFERIDSQVKRELAAAPAAHRRIMEEVTKIEADHKESTEVPPPPPEWIGVVEAVAKVQGSNDPMVANILKQIHNSLAKSQNDAIAEYRNAVQQRHKHLKALAPLWRQVEQQNTVVEKKVNDLQARTKIIDRHIDEYENILKKSDRAVHSLASSSLKDFFVSALVLAIAMGGAIINFNLIARPMAEMVGGNTMIGSFKTSEIAALVIILVEISMGLFLMEALRITQLFPVIGALRDKWRVIIAWITGILLTSLAAVEAGLAFMRELLVQDELATAAILRGSDAATAAVATESHFMWITTAAQMGMGFILPFALTFVAIPLETFVASLRTVLGMGVSAGLRGTAGLFRVVGGSFRYMGEFMTNVYDVLAYPVWFERMARSLLNLEQDPAARARRNSAKLKATAAKMKEAA